MGFHTVQKIFAAQHGFSGRALATLLVLAHRTDDATGQSWPSRKAISFSAGQSLRTTTRAIQQLAEAGVLLINRRASGVRRNLYTIDAGWLEMKSVRCSTRAGFKTEIHAQKRDPHPVQKPVEKFWKRCGRQQEKPAAPPATGANRGTQSYKEVLGKREIQVETGSTATGCESRVALPDLTALLGRLSMDAHGPRSRSPELAAAAIPPEFQVTDNPPGRCACA